MEVEVIGEIKLSKCDSTDKIACFRKVGDLAMICKMQVYISTVTSQGKTQEGSLTDS